MCKIGGLLNPDGSDSHDNVLKMFGVVFDDNLVEVQGIPLHNFPNAPSDLNKNGTNEISWFPFPIFHGLSRFTCQKVVFGANTCNKKDHTTWAFAKKWARKWFIFWCAILFEVKEDFWKMWLRIDECSKTDSYLSVLIENWLQNYLVLELCSNGDLKSYMDRRYDFLFSEIIEQLCQIAKSSPQNNAMYQVRIFYIQNFFLTLSDKIWLQPENIRRLLAKRLNDNGEEELDVTDLHQQRMVDDLLRKGSKQNPNARIAKLTGLNLIMSWCYQVKQWINKMF